MVVLRHEYTDDVTLEGCVEDHGPVDGVSASDHFIDEAAAADHEHFVHVEGSCFFEHVVDAVQKLYACQSA
ncbi:hypothetical protein D3C85_1784460 [compost metagenome]